VQRFQARVVSENYFSVLGRPPVLGGWLSPETEAAGTLDVIVSHRFWTTVLGHDASAVGRTLMVNGRRARVAGVTSAGFRGIEPSRVDLYFPFRSAADLLGRPGFLEDRGERSVRLLGRLGPGSTPGAAETALNGVMERLGEEFPGSNAHRTISVRRAGSVMPLELMGPALLPTAGLIFGATLVMLAISGVNVAAVLLARTIRRRREFAIRLSLGAGPLRLARQLVTESVVLALVAGILVVGLVSLLPLLADRLGVPPAIQPDIDLAVLSYAIAVAIGFGVVFGLAPALVGLRSDVVESLRSGESGARPTRARMQRILVGCQLALSMVLLIVGGALLASLDRQQRIDPGFSVDGLVVATFEYPTGTREQEPIRVFTRLVVERLSVIPGVTSVSVASMAPLTGDGMRSTIHIPGYSRGPGEHMDLAMVTGGPDVFRTLGIPLLRGRELTWEDRDSLPRVVINRSMALRYWGSRDPVGTFVRLGGEDGTPAEVIGIAADARFIALGEAPVPMYLVQRTTGGGETVLVRTGGDPSAVLLAVRGSMSRNDVPLTLAQLQTMPAILRTSLVVTRAVSDTLIAIGLLAVLLAAVGLYGVVSCVMAGRIREFGIRRALGATPLSITRLVLGYGVRLTVMGGIAGVVLGFGALKLISGMLFGSWSVLPIVGAAGLLLAAVTLVASAIPALRSAAAPPAGALRLE
jgi:predicted permease